MYSSGRLLPFNFATTLLDMDFFVSCVMVVPVVNFKSTALNPGFLACSKTSMDTPASSNSLLVASAVNQPSKAHLEAPLSSVCRLSCGPLQPLLTTFHP